jgi:hypothetical protein
MLFALCRIFRFLCKIFLSLQEKRPLSKEMRLSCSIFPLFKAAVHGLLSSGRDWFGV